MKRKKHLIAIFIFVENVSQLLTNALTFMKALITAPGNTFVSIPSTTITTMQNHITAAQTAETAVATGLHGTAEARDVAVGLVLTDVRNLVAIVQTAANNAADEVAAKNIITNCGLTVKKDAIKTKSDFTAENDTTSAGTLIFTFKAAGKGISAAYEIQESTDGSNYVTIKVTPDSRIRYKHGKVAGAKMNYRGRVCFSEKKGGAQKWITLSPIFVS